MAPIAIPSNQSHDPLGGFVAGACVAATRHPIPLAATQFDVSIAAGVAVVSTMRRFRNAQSQAIEATLTFPIPVHAVLFDLEARIDGRVVRSRAQRRQEARDTYEDAIDRGKAAVLHEEVLRGVHMISAHIAPGAEIEVRAMWSITLTNTGGKASLRIPLTVGDIYGRSGLPDSDALAHGGAVQTGEITVVCRDGAVMLAGRPLVDGRATVGLDAPIDLEAAFVPADLHGRSADGREVVVRIEPSRLSEAAVDIAAVIDHSGSMASSCADALGASKHAAVCAGLAAAAGRFGGSDRIRLWEFDDKASFLGEAAGAADARSLVRRLTAPRGGTEIGAALTAVVGAAEVPDMLLVTDGKSFAIDVQTLARSGRRFTVVLVGEDSLEANVGHLAALTGGEIFVAGGADLAPVLEAAFASLRAPRLTAETISGMPKRIVVARAGMTIAATWRPAMSAAGEADPFARAVAALAASLALPALDPETAAAFAVAEGLVTHLTSLVLVDEASAMPAGVPASRKVALPTPRSAVMYACYIGASAAAAAPAEAAPAARFSLKMPVSRMAEMAEFGVLPQTNGGGRDVAVSVAATATATADNHRGDTDRLGSGAPAIAGGRPVGARSGYGFGNPCRGEDGGYRQACDRTWS